MVKKHIIDAVEKYGLNKVLGTVKFNNRHVILDGIYTLDDLDRILKAAQYIQEQEYLDWYNISKPIK